MNDRLRAVVDRLDIRPNFDLGDRRFDTIFAVRVGLFHREPERARRLVEQWLAPGGAVFSFSDRPSTRSPS